MRNEGRKALHGAVIALAFGALAGCGIGPKMTEQPATYDLGPAPAVTADKVSITAILFVPEVSAPAWLSGNGIVYRLNFDNTSRAHAYTQSRWTAPPSALLTQRLRSRLAATSAKGIVTGIDGVRADYVLRVELDDFSQQFDAPASSRVAVRARASLVSLANRSLVAQREFFLEQPTSTADAAGGVRALGAVSDELVESLVKWTEERLKAAKSK